MVNIKKLFSGSWNLYKQHAWTLILLSLCMLGVNLAGANLMILAQIINIFLSVAFIKMCLDIVDGKDVAFRQIFKPVFDVKGYAKFIGLGILTGLGIMLGLVLLVIPGIVAMLGWLIAQYYFVDQKTGIREAMKLSWKATKGHRWKLLWFIIVTAVFNILGLLALGVGLLITIPMTYIMQTQIFRNLSGNTDTDEEEVVEEMEEEEEDMDEVSDMSETEEE